MNDIIVKLLAIYHYAKDIHYRASGKSFYGMHLLMDKIADGIHDQIDSINEVYYLGTGRIPPYSYDILKVVTATIPEDGADEDKMIDNLLDLLEGAKVSIEDFRKYNQIPVGCQSLIDDIQSTILQKFALLLRVKNI